MGLAGQEFAGRRAGWFHETLIEPPNRAAAGSFADHQVVTALAENLFG